MSSNTPSPHLLTLPTEIRDQIFKYVLLEHPEWSIKTWSNEPGNKSIHYIDPKTKRTIPHSEAQPQVQVLRTCKQINREYKQVIWKNRSFVWYNCLMFTNICRSSRCGLLVDSMDNITSLEMFIDWTGNFPRLALWCEAWERSQSDLEAFGRYVNRWKALKQVKLHLYDGGIDAESKHNARGLVYGIRSNRFGFMSPGDELNLVDCHRGFSTVLDSLRLGVDNIAFPHKIRRANGSLEKLTQILDLGLKWNDYSDSYHMKNWATLTAILKACHVAFGGGELWVDGILCWKDDVEQACMKSIETLRLCQQMQISV